MNIKNKIDELRKILEYHNDRYYNKDDTEISDYEYDQISQDLRGLEQLHPEFIINESPTQKVGGNNKRELKKVQHDVPIISLQDVFSKKDIYNFVDKKVEELVNPTFIVEKKIDGLTVVLRYINGEFVEGITRGNGLIGESVFLNLLEIQSIPKKIPCILPYLEVRGEVYMSTETFENVNKKQEVINGKIYQTARNLAAGSLRQLDSSIVKDRNLDIFVFNLEICQGRDFKSHSETLNWLSSQGFAISPDFKICKTSDEVWACVSSIGVNRWNLPFGIDGAVIKIDNLEDRKSLGTTSKVPRWAIAYKYPPEQKETIVENIQVQVGRTGRLTPLAILKPVKLAGTTVSKATLHNQDYIDLKDIQIGDTVVIQKAGDIIPEVIRSVPEKRPDYAKRYVIPDVCPMCGAPTIKDENSADVRCTDSKCFAQAIRKVIYFASKDAMNIEGLGPSTVEALMTEGYIKNFTDIYYIKDFRDELIEKGIVGKDKSVVNILNAIGKSKENDIDRLLTGLGIRNVGKQSARVLAQIFPDINSLINANYEKLISLQDFGDTMVNDIIDYFSQNENKLNIERLERAGVNMKSKAGDNIKDNTFAGKTFVLTGTLPSMTREDATALIQSHGGKVSNSVSKNTSYVLVGDDAGSKLTKANELGVQIILQDDLINMFS